MHKKLLSLVLALVMSLSLCIPAWAMDTNDSTETNVPNTATVVDCKNMLEFQREQAFQEFMRKITSTTDVPMLKGNLGYHKTDYGKTVTKAVVGYPGNQYPEGYSFSEPG